MIHKTIVVTIGLALGVIAVISAVPMTQQLVYAAGSPGVGSNGGSGTGSFTFNQGSTGTGGSGSHGITCNVDSSGTGGSGASSGGGGPACGISISNCIIPRGGSCNVATVGTGGSGAGGSTAVVGKIGQGGNGAVGAGGSP